jgi:hypothetical protein
VASGIQQQDRCPIAETNLPGMSQQPEYKAVPRQDIIQAEPEDQHFRPTAKVSVVVSPNE